MIELASIVEGDGDVEALPVLLRRLALTRQRLVYPTIHRPIRFPRTKLHKAGELERYCELAARKTRRRGAVLVLFDSDDDCPKHLAPQLVDRVQKAILEVPCAVVLANREFEAWFLAAAQSIAGQRALAANLTRPVDPESVRGAKDWLSNHMTGHGTYSETVDQAALAGLFDLDEARRSRSFDKLCREFDRLLNLLTERLL